MSPVPYYPGLPKAGEPLTPNQKEWVKLLKEEFQKHQDLLEREEQRRMSLSEQERYELKLQDQRAFRNS